jgi:ferrochelatase
VAGVSRVAVVLFNLGGPDSPAAIEPFLRNLFSDPAILRVPGALRWVLARAIAARRAPVAREIYARIGGRSPILAETRAQAEALSRALAARMAGHAFRVSIAMRYWHPRAAEAAAEVAGFRPDRVVLLPLYPQYSTTTTASSAADWGAAARAAGTGAPATLICCYPEEAGLVAAHAAATAAALAEARAKAPAGTPVRLLFSAHGLPERVVAGGDPYRWQVERTVAAVSAALRRAGAIGEDTGVETVTCYQSRVGPLAWIGPATDAEVARAARTGAAIVVAPIAFVSEHSETLVELDIEGRALAGREGAACYVRVPALGTSPSFIEGLARLVEAALACRDAGVVAGGVGARLCPASLRQCPCAASAPPGGSVPEPERREPWPNS